MKKIVLLSQDQKAASQADQWLRDLPEQVALEVFATLADFEAACFPDLSPDPGALEPAPGTATAAVLPISIVMADADALGQDPLAAIEKLRRRMGEVGAVAADAPLAVVVLAYDSIRAFRHELVDDLIMKPLDRSLFLQKLENLLAADEAAASSFLFKQKTSLMVEMGKETTVDRIGESGFAIRNPAPLVDGLFARVYCPLFGERTESAIYGRSYKNERHPAYPDEFLVYFSFFGATQTQLQRIRKFIKTKTAPSAPGAGKPAAAAAHADQLILSLKHVAVIDVDLFAGGQLTESLESNFENVRVHRFPSYGSFLAHAKAIHGKTPEAPAPPVANLAATGTAPLFPGKRDQGFVVHALTLELIEADPPLGKEQTALGASGEKLQERPDAWLEAFAGSERADLQEFAGVIAGGRAAGRAAKVTVGGAPAFVEIRGRREKAADGEGEARLRFDMKEIEPKDYDKLAFGGGGGMEAVDAVLIDGGLINGEPQAWCTDLREVLAHAGLTPAAANLPIIVLGDEGSHAAPEKFRVPDIRDFLYRPLDRRLVVEKATLSIKGVLPRPGAPPVEFHACSASAKVVKDVEIKEFSEYGALIRHASPLREDAFVALFGAVFSGQEGEPLWARCTHCARVGDDADYQCFFRFFGISDETLKRIRAWIRQDYVAKKEASA